MTLREKFPHCDYNDALNWVIRQYEGDKFDPVEMFVSCPNAGEFIIPKSMCGWFGAIPLSCYNDRDELLVRVIKHDEDYLNYLYVNEEDNLLCVGILRPGQFQIEGDTLVLGSEGNG